MKISCSFCTLEKLKNKSEEDYYKSEKDIFEVYEKDLIKSNYVGFFEIKCKNCSNILYLKKE